MKQAPRYSKFRLMVSPHSVTAAAHASSRVLSFMTPLCGADYQNRRRTPAV
jgi:hypothetical protein